MFALMIFNNGMFKVFPISSRTKSITFNEDWVTVSDDLGNVVAHYPTVNNIQEISFHLSKEAAEDSAAQYNSIG